MKHFLVIVSLLAYQIYSLAFKSDFSRYNRQTVISYAILPSRRLLKSSSASVGEIRDQPYIHTFCVFM